MWSPAVSNMIQVWTSSLTDKALVYAAAVMAHGAAGGVVVEDGQVKCRRGGAADETSTRYEEAAAIPGAQRAATLKALKARLGIVVSIPAELAPYARAVAEPSDAFDLPPPTSTMLAAGADVLPLSIDHDEAMRLAAEVFFAMMSRMPHRHALEQDQPSAETA